MIYFPDPLMPGDTIALLSPASIVKEEYVLGAMERLMERGYNTRLMTFALGPADGNFAASKGDRFIDLIDAIQDSDIKAILCTRGGYGCCQLVANLSYGTVASNPKWIIGFSDVSALLATWYCSDVASIHGPMAKHLATRPADDPCTQALFNILENGGKFDYTVSPHNYNREGKARGILVGGNMAVLNDLIGSPCDVLSRPQRQDIILFLEDINEPIYKVNRMLWHLYLTGALLMVKGIVFGQFTDYRPDANFDTMEDMIHQFFERNFPLPIFPVAFGFPTGHTDLNYPLTVGATVELEVTDTKTRLRTL
ncbi:MAG: LD-carboxypeptidase [Muribaculaceae bacterium]|nr:LD-carboxypeptidase [Muribaculaceae bacterium]